MNDYFKAFENIDQSVEQLLIDEPNSLEIKELATSLRKSVKPCFEELKQSATKLRKLTLGCSDELYRAENVWLSKPKIADASKQEIWKQIGEISGRTSRIIIIGEQRQNQAFKQAKESWQERIERLARKWFIDNQKQTKKSLSWAEKDKIMSDLKIIVSAYVQDIYAIISRNISPVYKEWQAVNSDSTKQYINLLDNHTKAELITQIDLMINNVEAKFNNQLNLSLSDKIFNQLNALANQNMFGIEWERFVNFKNEVNVMIENTISLVFDDRVKLAIQALEQAITFYNDFLERQERYQQETPEQREAEKAWIDKQRRELEQVQHGIEAILNAS